MNSYITKSIQVIFRFVFKGILAYIILGPRSHPDFKGLLLVMSVKLIFNDIWLILKIFIFMIFHVWTLFYKNQKKNESFTNLPNMIFYGLKFHYLT